MSNKAPPPSAGLNLSNVYGVGYYKIQEMLKNSPWFVEHGELVGRSNITYRIPKRIDIVPGSSMDHFIGYDVFCLSGDTIIRTLYGDRRLDQLVNYPIELFTYNTEFKTVESDIPEDIINTKDSSEYYEIELQDGTVIKCTEGHKFLLSNGQYKSVEDLAVEDELKEI